MPTPLAIRDEDRGTTNPLRIPSGIVSGMDTRIPSVEEVENMTDQDYKVLENRLRRAAQRQGYRLEKSRLRDPFAVGYGTYQIRNPEVNGVMYGTDGMHLAQIAEWLWSEDK